LKALIDSGAQGSIYVDTVTAQTLCEELEILPVDLVHPKIVNGYNGDGQQRISESIHPTLKIGDHIDSNAPMHVTNLGTYDLIIGYTYLKNHGVVVDPAMGKIWFRPNWCQHGPVKEIAKTDPKVTPVDNCLDSPKQTIIHLPPPIEQPRVTPMKILRRGKIPYTVEDSAPPEIIHSLDICAVSATSFRNTCRQARLENIFEITLQDIAEHQEKQSKPEVDPSEILPSEYHECLDVCSKAASNTLPPHRPYDHQIRLEEGIDAKQVGYTPLRRMSDDELKEVKKYLDENLGKGFIVASAAGISSPILFVRKPNGGLRFCVDYRRLNSLTKKDRYPLPLIEETLARLGHAKIFTKLDIRQAFYRVRISEEDEDLTTFRTRFGSFKYRVMPFGLTNGPATYQHFMNDVLFDCLDKFVSAYLDDILIYSENLEEHQRHVREVLERLRKAGLQVDIEKCEFHVTETKYLGLIIGQDGIRMDPEKIRVINEWDEPKTVKQVQAFLGLCNFYRRFIRSFGSIARPLTQLTRKNVPFRFGDVERKAFEGLKAAITRAPVLAHFDRTKKLILEADSSDHVSGGVLSQIGDDGELHPVAFFSKNLSPAECNYEIYDKELLAIIRGFEAWRPELVASEQVVDVITDHRALEYFMSTKKLSRRQARWAEYISQFDFQIIYRPGRLNERADALTRRAQDRPATAADARVQHQMQTLLKPEMLSDEVKKDLNLTPNVATIGQRSENETNPNVEQDASTHETNKNIEQDASTDKASEPETNEPDILEEIRRTNRTSTTLDELRKRAQDPNEPYNLQNGYLFWENRLVVAEDDRLRTRLISHIHRQPAVGHPGRTRTLQLIRDRYYWLRLRKTVERYVRNCHDCRRAKAPTGKYQGLLKPLPIPERPWRHISVDFVGPLPMSNEMNTVMVVIDRLTKLRHLIPCFAGNGNLNPETTARLFLRHVWKHHGLPDSIVSDRGSVFVSYFWTNLCKMLGISQKPSTAFHPQTDGQTEAANKEAERYLRTYVDYHQQDWVEWLPLAEFAANAMRTESTEQSPFFLTTGQDPKMDFDVDGLQEPQSTNERLQQDQARVMATRMQAIWDFARDNITKAQARQSEAANRHRKDVVFNEGDSVWLSTKNLKTDRPSKKLDHKMIGPFKIIRAHGNAYTLDLPASMAIHPTFHASLLSKDPNDPLPGQHQEPPPPVKVNDQDEWEVDDILASRLFGRGKRLQFKIKWKGYPPDDTWYNADGGEFDGSQAIIDAFFTKFPDASGSPSASQPVSRSRGRSRRLKGG
jgi:transposase InsO family protein